MELFKVIWNHMVVTLTLLILLLVLILKEKYQNYLNHKNPNWISLIFPANPNISIESWKSEIQMKTKKNESENKIKPKPERYFNA